MLSYLTLILSFKFTSLEQNNQFPNRFLQYNVQPGSSHNRHKHCFCKRLDDPSSSSQVLWIELGKGKICLRG